MSPPTNAPSTRFVGGWSMVTVATPSFDDDVEWAVRVVHRRQSGRQDANASSSRAMSGPAGV